MANSYLEENVWKRTEGLNLDTENESLETKLSLWKKYRGILFAFVGALFCSSTALVMKELSHYHPITVSLWYYAAVLFPATFYFIAQQLINKGSTSILASIFPVDSREKVVLLISLTIRVIFGSTVDILQIWSLNYLSLGDSSIFSSSQSIFVVFFAHCCLNEKWGFVPIGISIFAIFGIFLIVRPPILTGQTSIDTNNLYGVIISFISLIIGSSLIVLLRRIRKVNWLLIQLLIGLCGFLETLSVAWALGVVTLPVGIMDSLLAYVALPITVTTANVCITFAFKFEEAGRVTIISTLGILFSFLLQFLFFNVHPDAFSFGGGAIVTFGVILITCRKWVEELPLDDKRRQHFKYLLL